MTLILRKEAQKVVHLARTEVECLCGRRSADLGPVGSYPDDWPRLEDLHSLCQPCGRIFKRLREGR